MKVLKWVLIVILVLVVITAGIGFMMPKEVKVTVTEEIALPPYKVFHFVAGFVDRTSWDPWIKTDTATECTFDIKPGYTGSTYKWQGPKIGTGLMEVDSVVIGSYLHNKVSFSRGAPVPEEWIFTPSEEGTGFTWTITMSSPSPFGRIMNSMFRGMIQKTMESGKADLKNYLETNGVTMSTVADFGIEDYPAIEALTLTGSGTFEQTANMLGEFYGRIFAEVEAQKLQPQGMPFAYFTNMDLATKTSDMTAGVAVSAGGKDSGDIKAVKFSAFRAARAIHTGPYEEMESSYETLGKYAADNGMVITGDSWEFYLNDPMGVPDQTLLQTLILLPVVGK